MKTKFRSILILRFSSIGDIVQTTSVVGTLKFYFPDAIIDFMTLSKFAPLLKDHKKINNIHSVDIKDGYLKLKKIGLNINKLDYDLVIDLHNSTRSKIILSSIRRIKKLRLPKPRWKRFNLFMFHLNLFSKNFSVKTWLHDPLKDLFPLGYKMAKTHLNISDSEKYNGLTYLKNYNVEGNYYVVTPGAAWSQKRWLANHYSEVIDRINKKYSLSAVIIGGKRDKICDQIYSKTHTNVVNIKGKTNLRESLAIVSQADFVLGNDTGFLHAGESLGVFAITILGPTSRETGAGIFLKNSSVIENKTLWCRPCSQNGSVPCYRREQYCMSGIKPDMIMHAVSKLNL